MRQVSSKFIVIATAIVIAVTSTIYIIYGVRNTKPLIEDTIILISILSGLLFLFLTVGLYKGIKLKDDIGDLTRKIRFRSLDFGDFLLTPPLSGSSIGEFLLGLILWLVVAAFLLLIFWLFGNVLIILFLLIAAGLYWIFLRALRIVFRKSDQCKGDLGNSTGYGLLYTFLYTAWMYLIILGVYYFDLIR